MSWRSDWSAMVVLFPFTIGCVCASYVAPAEFVDSMWIFYFRRTRMVLLSYRATAAELFVVCLLFGPFFSYDTCLLLHTLTLVPVVGTHRPG